MSVRIWGALAVTTSRWRASGMGWYQSCAYGESIWRNIASGQEDVFNGRDDSGHGKDGKEPEENAGEVPKAGCIPRKQLVGELLVEPTEDVRTECAHDRRDQSKPEQMARFVGNVGRRNVSFNRCPVWIRISHSGRSVLIDVTNPHRPVTPTIRLTRFRNVAVSPCFTNAATETVPQDVSWTMAKATLRRVYGSF